MADREMIKMIFEERLSLLLAKVRAGIHKAVLAVSESRRVVAIEIDKRMEELVPNNGPCFAELKFELKGKKTKRAGGSCSRKTIIGPRKKYRSPIFMAL